jgi:hypothetical protein
MARVRAMHIRRVEALIAPNQIVAGRRESSRRQLKSSGKSAQPARMPYRLGQVEIPEAGRVMACVGAARVPHVRDQTGHGWAGSHSGRACGRGTLTAVITRPFSAIHRPAKPARQWLGISGPGTSSLASKAADRPKPDRDLIESQRSFSHGIPSLVDCLLRAEQQPIPSDPRLRSN